MMEQRFAIATICSCEITHRTIVMVKLLMVGCNVCEFLLENNKVFIYLSIHLSLQAEDAADCGSQQRVTCACPSCFHSFSLAGALQGRVCVAELATDSHSVVENGSNYSFINTAHTNKHLLAFPIQTEGSHLAGGELVSRVHRLTFLAEFLHRPQHFVSYTRLDVRPRCVQRSRRRAICSPPNPGKHFAHFRHPFSASASRPSHTSLCACASLRCS